MQQILMMEQNRYRILTTGKDDIKWKYYQRPDRLDHFSIESGKILLVKSSKVEYFEFVYYENPKSEVKAYRFTVFIQIACCECILYRVNME